MIGSAVQKYTHSYQNLSLSRKHYLRASGNNPVFILRHTIVAGYYGFTLNSHVHPSVCLLYIRRYLFPDDNLNKYQWNFANDICIDIMEILFGIVNGQFSSILDRVICPPYV